MRCKKPFMKGSQPYGCGQCQPCRINKRREWTNRIVLESGCHAENTFLTLTYDPKMSDDTNLRPKDLQDFWKRLRKIIYPHKLRYFACGEYGDRSGRAHYHAAIFGIGPDKTEWFTQAWGKGFVYAGDLTRQSAQYIAGYVTKKMTSKDDKRLNGRHPEFARMSLRPGIGALAVPTLADSLTTDHGSEFILRNQDVPNELRISGKKLPLARYLRRRLRKHLGFPEESTSPVHLKAFELQMHKLYEDFKKDPRFAEIPSAGRKEAFKKWLVEKNEQASLNLVNKQKIFSKKGNL